LIAVGFAFAATLGTAEAEIYKYVDKDGNVVYTDNLSSLPSKRRVHYLELKSARAEQREVLEKRIGKDELERREKAKKKNHSVQKKMSKREHASRQTALQLRNLQADKERKSRNDEIQAWQSKIDKLRVVVNSKVGDYQKAQKLFKQSAFQYSSTGMLIHAQRRNEAMTKMKQLEGEIDRLIHQINVELPAKARAFGIRVR